MEFQLINVKDNGNKQSSFGKYQSNNCFSQEPPMDTKLHESKYNEKQDKCIILKYHPTRFLLIMKRKIATLQWRNLADPTLTK